MNHTKGEWKTKMSADGSRIIYAEKENGDELICRDVRHYNVNLLVAAPYMYEALKDLTSIMKMACSMNYLYKHNLSLPLNKAESILAKAEGK